MKPYFQNPEFKEKFRQLKGDKNKLAFNMPKNISKQIDVLKQLAEKESISENEFKLLESAIWIFHAGHYVNYPAPLEDIPALLKSWGSEPNDTLEKLLKSLATKSQGNKLEEILHDAVNSFWADTDLEKRLVEIKSDEKQHATGKDLTTENWVQEKALQLKLHKFITTSAQELLGKPKKDNGKKIKKIIKNFEKQKDDYLINELKIDANHLKSLKKKLAKTEGKPDRGIETMFRLASRNLYTRARILDAKSSILITVNSIILSVVLGTLYTQLADDPHLIFPIIALLFTNLGSLGFAIISSRPVLRDGKFIRQDVRNKEAGLLNFDDYHAVSLDDYVWAMDYVMEDSKYLYHTITWDLYNMGKRMFFKYKNLRIAYNIFLWGLIISVLMFISCHLFPNMFS